jgi:alpha-galactosidase/6-phospho-beta-glucosidase family protein
MWRQVDAFNTGETPISEYMRTFGPDHATDIIENMVAGLGKVYHINTANQGAVGNMADDAFLELLCDVDMDGPRPREVGDMPRGILAMQQTVLDTDPLTCSIADADAIIEELMAREAQVLPEYWHAAETVGA